jgi:type IV pilus assembly protein PilY1
MTKPEATIENSGECVYLGSGDREHLTNVDSVDAFYTICNEWVKTKDENEEYVKDANGDFVYEPVSFDDLADVTENLSQDGNSSQKATINSSLQNSPGWFIRMEHSGEKITSSPIVIDGKVFFNTFTPGSGGITSTDPCTASYDLGVSRLYAVDYRTGAAVMNLDDSTDGSLTKSDRSVVIGTSVASDPILTTVGDKTTLVSGSGGKTIMFDVDTGAVLRRYYWRQVK